MAWWRAVPPDCAPSRLVSFAEDLVAAAPGEQRAELRAGRAPAATGRPAMAPAPRGGPRAPRRLPRPRSPLFKSPSGGGVGARALGD